MSLPCHSTPLAPLPLACTLTNPPSHAQSHKASLDRKVAERRSDVAAQASELEGVERECASLRARLAVQTVRPADVQRMAAERVAAERELRAATAAREALEARLAAAERALGSALDALEGALGRYHARAAALQLVPAGAKRAGGCAYEVAYDRGAAAAGALPAPDWKGGVRRGLEELAGAYRSRARALGSERLSLRERAANLATAAGDRREEVAAAQAELARLEAAQEGLKDALAALVEAEGRQVAELQAEVAALRGKGGSTLAASEEDLRELQARYEDDVRWGALGGAMWWSHVLAKGWHHWGTDGLMRGMADGASMWERCFGWMWGGCWEHVGHMKGRAGQDGTWPVSG